MIKVNKIVVFASGNGTTLQAIIDSIKSKKLNMGISLVVSNKEDAYALERARRENIKTYVIKSKTTDDIDIELDNVLKDYDFQMIVLAGYLRMIGTRLLDKYCIINTHPSLLPKYGGKNMHGINVHRAVVENREKETGATIHFVDSKYDHGNIISQTKVEVLEDDTPEMVEEKVQKVEKEQLISVLVKASKGELI